MLRPHPSVSATRVIPVWSQGWEELLQATPTLTWMMVPVLGRKLEEGWREVGACLKSDKDSDKSDLWHEDDWQRTWRCRDSGENNPYLKCQKPCHVWGKTALFCSLCMSTKAWEIQGNGFQCNLRKNFLIRRTLQRLGGLAGTDNLELSACERGPARGPSGQIL